MARHVALFGLGIMGSGFAKNLLSKGFTVWLYNRTRTKAEPFAAEGAHICDTPEQAAANADVLLSVVGDDDASRAVWLGETGALKAVRPGAVMVECSTLTPVWIRELAGLANERSARFIDAPIAGSRQAAAAGEVTLFLGGEVETIAEVGPVFQAISRRQVHLGPVGAAATWKLINNMMLAVHTATVAEALVLAEAARMNLDQVVPLILNGASASGIVQGKLPRMLERRYEDTEFALKWMQKDARYAVQLAEGLGMPLEMVQAAVEVFQRARDRGLDDLDFSAVIEGLRKPQ